MIREAPIFAPDVVIKRDALTGIDDHSGSMNTAEHLNIRTALCGLVSLATKLGFIRCAPILLVNLNTDRTILDSIVPY